MTSGPDLILGVSRAADTAKQREAAARLERLSRPAGADVATASDWASTTASAGNTSDWSTELRRAAIAQSDKTSVPNPVPAADGSAKPDVYVQFEALLLQNMVEAMMPQDSESMFGSGTAGGMWKSMLAEKVAAEIARSGATGIAKQMAAAEGERTAAASNNQVKVDKT
jgi:hypothetical protein